MAATGGDTEASILIAGPGRSGTTLLVELLTAMGLDTGVDRLEYSEQSHAGLEANWSAPDAPRVVKNPALSWQLRELIESGSLDPRSVDHLIVPLRSLPAAAASRVRTTIRQWSLTADGGMTATRFAMRQQSRLAEVTYGLFETAALYELPLVTLEYPRFAIDPAYAFRRLRPVFADQDQVQFESAWRSVVRDELVIDREPSMPALAELRVSIIRLCRLWRLGRLKIRAARQRLVRMLA